MRTLWLTSTTTSGQMKRLKPVFSTSILYRPGNRFTKENNPSLPVGCVRFSAVPRLVKVTCASVTAPPAGSVIAPAIEPYVDWATSGGLSEARHVKRTTRERKTNIALSFFIRDFLQLRQPY